MSEKFNWWDRVSFRFNYRVSRIPTASHSYYIEVSNRLNSNERLCTGLMPTNATSSVENRAIENLIKELKLQKQKEDNNG